MCITELRLNNLGLKTGVSNESIIAALIRKLNLAGSFGRFMLDYNSAKVIDELNDAVDRLNSDVVSVGGSLVPVSFTAGIMMALSKKFNTQPNRLTQNILDALHCKHKAMLGWLFEQEVTDRLKASLPKEAIISDIVGYTRPIVTSDSDLDISKLLKSLSIRPVVNLDATVPFQLVRADTKDVLDISMKGIIKPFESWQDLVELIVHHNWQAGPIWLLPLNYANPFFDFAFVDTNAENESVDMKTFQITISTTHSCKAMVMQLISTRLNKSNIKLNSVVHHAVLPSQEVAEKFEFKSEECMRGPTMVTRAAAGQQNKATMVTRAAAVQQNKAKRKRTECSYADFNDDDEDDPDVDDLIDETKWVWVDIQIGAHLVLTDSMCIEK